MLIRTTLLPLSALLSLTFLVGCQQTANNASTAVSTAAPTSPTPRFVATLSEVTEQVTDRAKDGQSSEYSVTFHPDGTVERVGDKKSAVPGTYKATIMPDEVQKLADDVQDCGFPGLPATFGIGSLVGDHSLTISVVISGKRTTVRDYQTPTTDQNHETNALAPKTLETAEDQINSLIKKCQWAKVSDKTDFTLYGDPESTSGTVSIDPGPPSVAGGKKAGKAHP